MSIIDYILQNIQITQRQWHESGQIFDSIFLHPMEKMNEIKNT